MKKRLYKRNVIDGQVKWDNFKNEFIHKHRINIFLFIVRFFVDMAIAVAISVFLAKYIKLPVVSVVFTPIITGITIRRLINLYGEHEASKILHLDQKSYDDWMQLQMKKQFPQADIDLANAMFTAFQNSYNEKHDELLNILKEQLKKKPPNSLAISVIAGLIFLSKDKNDYDILFNAKYRHGPAGNVIPAVWIRVLSPDEDYTEKTHRECAEEFLNYWNKRQINSAR